VGFHVTIEHAADTGVKRFHTSGQRLPCNARPVPTNTKTILAIAIMERTIGARTKLLVALLAAAFDFLRDADDLEDVWQLHLSENEGAENFPTENIANLDTQTAYWLKTSAHRDGTFSVLNGRAGKSKMYASR
jgi:hypothetical protein